MEGDQLGINRELAVIANRQPDTRAHSRPTLQKSSSETKPSRKLPKGMADLDEAQVSENFKHAMQAVVKSGAWPVFLFGATGRGKTYAAAYVFSTWGGSPVWEDATDVVRKITRCRSSRDGVIYLPCHLDGMTYAHSESQIIERINAAPLVVLDDIGLRAPSEAAYDVIYKIVNCRAGKPTIYTSNLSPAEIYRVYDARIASRMISGTTIEMTGSDRRMSKTRIVRV